MIKEIINLNCQDMEGYFSMIGLHVGYVGGRTVSLVAIYRVSGIQSAKIIRQEFLRSMLYITYCTLLALLTAGTDSCVI